MGKISRKKGKTSVRKRGEERTTRLMWPQKAKKSSLLLERRKSVKKTYFFVRGLVRRRSAGKREILSLTSMSEDGGGKKSSWGLGQKFAQRKAEGKERGEKWKGKEAKNLLFHYIWE